MSDFDEAEHFKTVWLQEISRNMVLEAEVDRLKSELEGVRRELDGHQRIINIDGTDTDYALCLDGYSDSAFSR